MKKILVPTDFSAHAERALEYGAAFARIFDAEIELVTSVFLNPVALGPYAFALPEGHLAQAEAHAREGLEAVASPLREEGLVVSCKVAREDPSIFICSHAAAVEADLIAMGTHGRTGLPHVLLGSVAERTVRRAPSPVLTVHSDSPSPGPLDRVLVATDFSKGAEAALSWAFALIRRTGGSLILAHSIVPRSAIPEVEAYTEGVPGPALEDEARTKLQAMASGLECEVEIAVAWGHLETAGLELAKRHGARLVVVGTRGRTGLPHVILGSAAERFIRHSDLPVVAVKAPS
jgi:nucleotide-binding universal stress UspA family protein